MQWWEKRYFKKYTKLGNRDYAFPEDHQNAELNAARDLFLAYIVKLVPEVIDDLAAILPEMDKLNYNPWLYAEWKPLRDWAQKYKLLENPWLLNRAVNTLLLWRINPSLIGNGFCGGAAVNLGLPEKTAVNFEVQAWNPAQVTWQEYEKYLDNKFKNLKAEYRKKMEVSARERGLKKVPFLRADKKFEWLVRHLVRGENYEKIADGAGCDPDNVKIRIREAARACGLQRLPPGRPRRET